MPRARFAIVLAVALFGAGCSGSPAPAPSGPAPAPSSESASAAPSGAGTPASGTTAECLAGSYAVTKLVGVGDASTFGTGEGGDAVIDFSAGTYRLHSDGAKPISLTLAGQRGQLVLKGEINGTWSGELPSIAFAVGSASGSGTISALGQKRTLTMDQVAQVLAPRGTAEVRCAGSTTTVNMDAAVLELERT